MQPGEHAGGSDMSDLPPLETAVLPDGVRARFVDGINGLRMHILEAGFESPGRPLVLLLHGFPELAYSWRNIIVPLGEAGFHVVAPDQRGGAPQLPGDSLLAMRRVLYSAARPWSYIPLSARTRFAAAARLRLARPRI